MASSYDREAVSGALEGAAEEMRRRYPSIFARADAARELRRVLNAGRKMGDRHRPRLDRELPPMSEEDSARLREDDHAHAQLRREERERRALEQKRKRTIARKREALRKLREVRAKERGGQDEEAV